MDSVEDGGLKAIASTCRGLKHLRVYPQGGGGGVSSSSYLASFS